MNEKDYFDGVGSSKAPVAESPKEKETGKEHGEPLEEGVTVHTKRKGDKFHTTVDNHDGYPPDEMEHDTMDDAKAAHAKAIEDKYGTEETEEAEEHVAPGVHEKAGSYLKHMMEK